MTTPRADNCPKGCGHETFHYCGEGTHCDKHCVCACHLCVAERAPRIVSAFDDLRGFIAAARGNDSRSCVLTSGDLRAAVAEHDALRDAVRALIATVRPREVGLVCSEFLPGGADCGCPDVVGIAVPGYESIVYGVCVEHARHYDTVAPLPPRVVTLRALAALVRS